MTNSKSPRRMARPPYGAPGSAEGNAESGAAQSQVADGTEKRVTKQSQVIAMLCADGGTTLAAIVAATGWQAHTARAALTGLRKKGHAVERSSVDGETRYRIIEAAAE